MMNNLIYAKDMIRVLADDAVPAPAPFVPGVTPVPYAGRVFDRDEIRNLVTASLEFWLTQGHWTQEFEEGLCKATGHEFASFCNSGSSANLLALAAVAEARGFRPGDEIITPAVGFPTTVNPIIQLGFVPVFVDVDLRTYNLDAAAVEQAASPRTRAVMFAHALGNPADMDALTSLCSARKWELIEDCCDALGSTYRGRQVGTFGAASTLSFFPAHHITTGEGGAVLTNDPQLKRLVDSYRDWGRDCQCAPGEDNSCGNRFSQEFPGLPDGYDHKFVYSRVGWNLKATDLQAAIGVAQLSKLAKFIAARRANWDLLRDGLADLEDHFFLPKFSPGADPSWFGFALRCKTWTRSYIVNFLESRKISTRPLFGGNLTRQPAYQNVGRVGSWLGNSNIVMNDVFWLGVYPGLSRPMLDYVIESVHEATR